MYALAPRIDILLHVPHPRIRRVQAASFRLTTCEGDVEHLKTTRKEREGEFAFRKNAHPPQEADGAEECRELARCAESGE
jgi:hypothetical protein